MLSRLVASTGRIRLSRPVYEKDTPCRDKAFHDHDGKALNIFCRQKIQNFRNKDEITVRSLCNRIIRWQKRPKERDMILCPASLPRNGQGIFRRINSQNPPATLCQRQRTDTDRTSKFNSK